MSRRFIYMQSVLAGALLAPCVLLLAYVHLWQGFVSFPGAGWVAQNPVGQVIAAGVICGCLSGFLIARFSLRDRTESVPLSLALIQGALIVVLAGIVVACKFWLVPLPEPQSNLVVMSADYFPVYPRGSSASGQKVAQRFACEHCHGNQQTRTLNHPSDLHDLVARNGAQATDRLHLWIMASPHERSIIATPTGHCPVIQDKVTQQECEDLIAYLLASTARHSLSQDPSGSQY